MPPYDPIQRIGCYERGVTASRRLISWSTKIETAARDTDLRESDQLVDTVLDTKIHRIELGQRRAGR